MLVPLNKTSNEIAQEIVNLVETGKKKPSSNIIISNIVTPKDDYKTNANEVNKILEEICGKKGIPLIWNNNINSKRYLNRGRLHLNDTGLSVLVRNFNPIEDGRLQGCSRMEEAKKPPSLKSVTHILKRQKLAQ